MNLGLIVRQALQKAGLPIDAAHLELAKNDCNFIIQDLWYSTLSKHRISRGTINTVSGADEYVLNKLFDRFVKYTMQGPSSNPRYLEYLEPEEFFRKIKINVNTTGDPLHYTFGDVVGYDAQLTSASKVKVYSSLASKTTGQISVVNGSDVVRSTTDIFSLNDVGLRLKRSGDYKTYKIGQFISPNEIRLVEKYRGQSGSGVDYAIGDVGVRVNITSFVGGQIVSEDIELSGASQVLSTKTSNTLVSISKSERTGGAITVQTEDGVLTVGTLAPNETEIERQTVLFWPKPDSAETLQFRFYMKHLNLWLDTDRLLLQEKWHRLVCYKLEKRLREGFGVDVPAGLESDIEKCETQFENEAEDLGLTDTVPDDTGRKHGSQFYYDKINEPDF